MKILHVSPSYYPAFRFGGPIQSVHLLNKSLVQLGHQLTVITTNAGLFPTDNILVNQWTTLDGMRIKYHSFVGYEHYNFSPALFLELDSLVKEFDLVHITAVWNFPVWAASKACRKHKVPYIISPRGTIYPETVSLKSSAFKKIFYLFFAEKSIKKANAIHFTAKDEEEKVTRYLGLNMPSFVIPNGLDFSEFKKTELLVSEKIVSLRNIKYILFLGRISKKKGLDILLDSFHSFHNDYPDYRLVIAGPDNEGYLEKVHQMVSSYKLNEVVLFTGELLGDDKLFAYRNAAFFVLSSYSENFGMSVAEAMASDLPVVITDRVGICTDISAYQAGIVTALSAASFLEGMKKAASLTDRISVISNAHRLLTELYDIRSVAKKMAWAYQQILTNKK